MIIKSFSILSKDETILDIINKGYKTIFSPWDKYYLDCGYSSWVGEGNNWCSPYKGNHNHQTLNAIYHLYTFISNISDWSMKPTNYFRLAINIRQ